MSNVTIVSFSIPKEILQKLDAKRSDVPRSRFLLNIIKQNLEKQLENLN